LNITVTDQEKCKKQVQIEIPSDVVQAEIDRKASTYARRITIPGFRPGRAPVNLVKKRFHKELRDEVVSELIPTSFDNAVKEKSLKVVAEPKLDDMKFGDDDSINATFTIETAPEFELPDYKKLTLTKHVHETTDEEVDKAVEMLREGRAELVPVNDRGAQTGDTVTLTLSGKADLDYQPEETEENKAEGAEASPEASAESATEAPSEEAAASTAEAEAEGEGDDAKAAEVEKNNELNEESLDITLGADGNLKSFDEALEGTRAGEKKAVSIDYPKEYPDPNFANRRWHFDLEVTAVRTKELPELDEEFLSSIDENVKTEEELRAKIRANYEARNTQHTKDTLRNEAMKQLIEANRFEVPEQLVEKQTQQRFTDSINNLVRSGIDVRNLGLDWKAMADSQRDKAVDDVRSFFILERIIEAENIEVSDEDFDREIEEMAKAMNQPAAALKARLTKEGGVDTIKEQIKHQKALDLIINSADIKEVVGEEKDDATESSEEESQAEGQA
jgi:trigger factor